jgi:hypothetical protein
MIVQHSPKFDQPGDRDPGATGGYRRANRGVAHPFRDLARQARLYFDAEDCIPGAPLPAINADPLAVQRMPGVAHHNKLRSVC